jgi:hypothetical protein
VDYLGQPKWSEADWAWQKETICLLRTAADRRSFAGSERLRGDILLSHFGREPIENGELEVTLEATGKLSEVLQRRTQKVLKQNAGTLADVMKLDWPLPQATSPTPLVLRAVLKTARGEFRNHWPLWAAPAVPEGLTRRVKVHESLSQELAGQLLPEAPRWDGSNSSAVVVAARFDDDLVRLLENGGRVLLLPDGRRDSLPLNAHWFLRGAPYVPGHALERRVPRNLLVELQHFDLAADVVPDINYLEAIDPILMLWDTHDLKTVKTHGLVFETRAARGRLLVSALRHAGAENAAGRWLLGVFLDHLETGAMPRNALPDEVWAYLRNKLHAERTNLVACAWRFKPDPGNQGLAEGWHKVVLASEDGWQNIRVGTAWESQGHPSLDGWAWYRLSVEIPARWQGRDVYLSFEGVDDIYELYVNGELAGKGGDLATRKDAFNEKKSHNIARFVKAGQTALLAVRVHDWYGAGGIFRPVTLGTLGFSPGGDLLR